MYAACAPGIPIILITFRPRSILGLILGGFALVILPLATALVSSAIYVDRVTEQGQRAVFDAAGRVSSGQALVDRLTAMERHARQYTILGDKAILDRYFQLRCAFLGALEELTASPDEADWHPSLAWLRANEGVVHAELASDFDAIDGPALARAFADMARDVRHLQVAVGGLVSQEAIALREAAAGAQRLLFWLSAIVVPMVVGLALVFLFFIVRPLRELDRAIRRLGAGEFTDAIQVTGPRDLEDLGRRLDWMRERLLELENQKVMFLRHMSHELKTPLASLREGAELLREEVVGALTPDQAEIAELLRANSVELQRIIEGLLAYSIGRSERPLAGREAVDLSGLVRSVLDHQRLAMRRKSLEVTDELATAMVVGDRDQLRTIADNLLSNAVKFSPNGGELKIRVHVDSGSVVLEVEDEGPGIAPDERDRVFEAFYQGSAVHRGHVKGTGLGLAIVRDYVEANHGEIFVESGNKGARFRIVLPEAGSAPAAD